MSFLRFVYVGANIQLIFFEGNPNLSKPSPSAKM